MSGPTRSNLRWTSEDKAQLRVMLVSGCKISQIAKALNRTEESVKACAAKKLRLRVTNCPKKRNKPR